MGASEFFTRSTGKTAQDAFRAAVEEARYEHGHGGYTGTIAEKRSFVMLSVPGKPSPTEAEASAYIETLVEKQDPRVGDKWGPACCIKLADGSFIFFGLASC